MKLLLCMILLCLATAVGSETIGRGALQPGVFISNYFVYYESDRDDEAYVTLKANADDVLDGSTNLYWFFQHPDLKVVYIDDRRYITFRDKLCAKQWRVFDNYKKLKACSLEAKLKHDEFYFFEVTLDL